jgi:NADPH-dependent ferric siderophore reductase
MTALDSKAADTDVVTNHLKPFRVRHEIKVRTVTVQSVTALSPSMQRVVFFDESLADFRSDGFDDHVKVFFPHPDSDELVTAELGDQGVRFAEDAKPIMRDYTPREFNHADKTLVIDFALHDAGPASDWAKAAKIGDVLTVAGPKGSMVVPLNYDAYVFFGDETALPAISRRLAELPAHATALVVAEVHHADDELPLHSAAQLEVRWLHRQDMAVGQAELFLQALSDIQWPQGEVYTWVAAETSVARQLRKALIEQFQISKERIKAAGYWQIGKVSAHEVVED